MFADSIVFKQQIVHFVHFSEGWGKCRGREIGESKNWSFLVDVITVYMIPNVKKVMLLALVPVLQ